MTSSGWAFVLRAMAFLKVSCSRRKSFREMASWSSKAKDGAASPSGSVHISMLVAPTTKLLFPAGQAVQEAEPRLFLCVPCGHAVHDVPSCPV
jgi:hypothetical protein